ncbi:MAG: 50S ribosomal protein L11 methyltransferase [Nitrospirota bacterium]|nr:50S ribosomal protein L11 methyltransferase [Nitrospirota bacterium]
MSRGIKQEVYDIVVGSNHKLTPVDVEKTVAAETGADRKVIKAAIKELVCEGVLQYSFSGTSFLEISKDKPFRVSERIVIKPPDKTHISDGNDIVIDIMSGAAFGDGGHPSTYLVLRVLDTMFSNPNYIEGLALSNALDVGTGTGILAIAAARLGMNNVVGIDIDPIALFEAERNVRINNLTEKITICNIPLEEITSSFSLIMANIGGQTLEMLHSFLVKRIEEGGMLVLSGFKTDGHMNLLNTYLQSGLILIRRDEERNWACLVLSKPRTSL